MASVKNYQSKVRELILQYAQYKPSNGEIAPEVIINDEQGHFELMHIGWDGPRRIHGSVIHIDIINGKIWIQHDGTSPGVAVELAEAGVPKEDIILGFRPAHLRQHTGFGVG